MFLANPNGCEGTIALTAVPPMTETGPNPMMLIATTLTTTVVPIAKLYGAAYKVLIGIEQVALAITD